MVKVLLFVALMNIALFAEIATENASLSTKANSADLFLIQSGSEYIHKSFYQTIPYSNRELYDFPAYDTYRLYGKKYEQLKATPQAKYTRIQTGNEVGDPLFQELQPGYVTESNRTPMTEAVVYSPEIYGLKLFGGIEQVDHFCSGDMAYKQYVLNRKERTFDASPYAWFGENYPQYSSVIAGGHYSFEKGIAQASYRSGWLWLNLKGSGRLLPYEMRISNASLSVNKWTVASRFHWKRYLGDDPLNHYSSYITDYVIDYNSWSDKHANHRIGVDMSIRSNDALVEYASPYILIPFAHFEYSDKKSLTIKNKIAYNGNYFLLRDSLVVRSNDTLAGLGINLHVTNRVNPRDDYWELASTGFVDTVSMDLQKLTQTYAAEAFFGEQYKVIQWQVYAAPWVTFNPHHFLLADTLRDNGYLLRSGEMSSHNGNVWGVKSSIKTMSEPIDRLTLFGTIQLQKQWGSAKSSLDFIESEFSALASIHYITHLDLELSFSSIFLTTRYMNNWGSGSIAIDGGWEHNITVKQYFLGHTLSMWFSALNIGAPDLKEHPNGSVDRFRIIAGLEWRY